jgi:hypothetical protein
LLAADDGSCARGVHAHAGSARADAVALGDLGVGGTPPCQHEGSPESNEELTSEPLGLLFDVLVNGTTAVGSQDGRGELVLEDHVGHLVGETGPLSGRCMAVVADDDPAGAGGDQGCREGGRVGVVLPGAMASSGP